MNKEKLINKYREKVKGIAKTKIYNRIVTFSFQIEQMADEAQESYDGTDEYSWWDDYEMCLDHFVDLLNDSTVKDAKEWLGTKNE